MRWYIGILVIICIIIFGLILYRVGVLSTELVLIYGVLFGIAFAYTDAVLSINKKDKYRKCQATHHPPPYKLTEKEFCEIIESLDDAGGWLIKESELRYWIEKKVNENLNKNPC